MAAHGQTWFWALLQKQQYLVARGQNPSLIFFSSTAKTILAQQPSVPFVECQAERQIALEGLD